MAAFPRKNAACVFVRSAGMAARQLERKKHDSPHGGNGPWGIFFFPFIRRQGETRVFFFFFSHVHTFAIRAYIKKTIPDP